MENQKLQQLKMKKDLGNWKLKSPEIFFPLLLLLWGKGLPNNKKVQISMAKNIDQRLHNFVVHMNSKTDVMYLLLDLTTQIKDGKIYNRLHTSMSEIAMISFVSFLQGFMNTKYF